MCGYSRGSTPASTRGDIRASSRTGTPAIISPTRRRTSSARSSVEPRRRKRRFSYTSRARRRREIMPVSYAARAKKTPEDPAIRVLSRSKNAAGRRWVPFPAGVTSHPENHSVALTATGADRRAAESPPAPAQLVDERAEDARARGADRMAEGDRATVDVDAILVDAEHANRVQRDRGERLVD